MTGRPSTSDGRRSRFDAPQEHELSANTIRRCMNEQANRTKQQETEHLILEAERGKAQILKPPGMTIAEMDHKLFIKNLM